MKYFIFIFLLATITLVKSYRRSRKGVWKFIAQINISANCEHKMYGVAFYNDRKWREPIYEAYEWFEVPGGKCPKKWQKKWSDVKLAVDHYVDLNYWFKWRSNMLHIEFEENLRNASTLLCHDVPLNALQVGFNFIMDEFVGPDENDVYYDIHCPISSMEPARYYLKDGELRPI